jgi:lysophospholipase L1-like esterase
VSTLTTGNSITISLDEGMYVTITSEPNTIGTVTRTVVNDGNTSQGIVDKIGPPAMSSTYGPYGRSATLTIECDSGTITYTTIGNPMVRAETNPNTGGLEINGQWSVPWTDQGLVNTVLIGDSMTASSSSGAEIITAVSRSSNVATATVSSTGGFTAGQLANVINMLDPSFNANDVVITILSGTQFTYPSVGADGSTTNLSASASMSVFSSENASDYGAFPWLQAKSGGAFNLLHNGGANGQTSANMLARFDTDCLAYAGDAKLLILHCGYNDFAISTRTAQAVYDDVTEMAIKAVNAGMKVIIEGALPWSSGVNASYLPVALNYNRMIRRFCNSTPNVRYADSPAYITNSTSTSYAPQTGMLQADGIHTSSRGGERRGQAYWDLLKYETATPSRRIVTLADAPANNPTGDILFAAPFTNSGGNLAGTASGTVCGGLYVQGVGSGTVVASAQSGFDGIGYNQRVVFTPAANNDEANIISGGYTVNVTPGQCLVMSLKMSLSGLSAANIRSINVNIEASGVAGKAMFSCGNTGASTLYSTKDETLTIVGVPFTVPTGVTAISWGVKVKAAGSGSALTFEVGQLVIEKI